MTSPVLLAFGQFVVDGEPCSFATVHFGQPNEDPLTDPKLVYADPWKAVPMSSRSILGAQGRPAHHTWIDGAYSIKIISPEGDTLAYWTNVDIDSEELTPLSVKGLFELGYPFIGPTGPLAGGKVYLGQPYRDPVANRKAVTDESDQPLTQPLMLDDSGALSAIIKMEGDYSVGVADDLGAVKYSVGSLAYDLPPVPPVDLYTYFICCTPVFNHPAVLYSQSNLMNISLPPWDLPYGPTRSASVSPDGRYLAVGPMHSASIPHIPVIDTSTWSLAETDAESALLAIHASSFSLDGTKFVTVDGDNAKVVQYEVGEIFTNQTEFDVDLVDIQTVYRADFVPSGLLVMGSSGMSGTDPLVLLDPNDNYSVITTFPIPSIENLYLVAGCVSPNKQYVAMALSDSGSSLCYVVVANTSGLGLLAGMTTIDMYQVRDVAFSDDNDWLAVAYRESVGGTPCVSVFHWPTADLITTLEFPDESLGGVAFSDDKQSLFLAFDDVPTVRQYAISDGSLLSESPGNDPPEAYPNYFGFHKVRLAYEEPIEPLPSVNQRMELRAVCLRGGTNISEFDHQQNNGTNTFTFPTVTVTEPGTVVAYCTYVQTSADIAGPTATITGTGVTPRSPASSSSPNPNAIRTGLGTSFLSSPGACSGSLNRTSDGASPIGNTGTALSFFVSGASFVDSTGSGESSSATSKTISLPDNQEGDLLVLFVMSRTRSPQNPPAGWQRHTSFGIGVEESFGDQFVTIYTRVAESGDSGGSVTVIMG